MGWFNGCKEGVEVIGEGNEREELIPGGVDASGRCIRRIAYTRDIARVGNCTSFVEKGVESSEDKVDMPVVAAAVPPALDNTLVITIDEEVMVVGSGGVEDEEGVDKELKTHHLSPANITSVCAPVWEECPCPPVRSDDDSDANT